MADSVALIERVRAAGLRLALLSNMPRPYAAHLDAAHACFGWFEHRAWSGRLGVMKPQRGIFDHVQATLYLDLADTISRPASTSSSTVTPVTVSGPWLPTSIV